MEENNKFLATFLKDFIYLIKNKYNTEEKEIVIIIDGIALKIVEKLKKIKNYHSI